MSVQHAFQSAIKKIKAAGLPIISIASDAETSFQSDMVAGGIKLRSSESPHTNHVRIVDRLMRTFRDALGVDTDNNFFEDYSMVKKLVEYYNKTPHKSLRMYGKTYTPHEVQSDVDLEWVYIRNKIRKLQEVRHNLMNKGLMRFEPGNILQCALSYGKTGETFNKRRRVLINNRYGNFSFFLARQETVFSDSFPWTKLNAPCYFTVEKMRSRASVLLTLVQLSCRNPLIKENYGKVTRPPQFYYRKVTLSLDRNRCSRRNSLERNCRLKFYSENGSSIL